MQKKNSTETLKHLIALLTNSLTELSDFSDNPSEQFAYGEKTAYVECLEWLSVWEQAEEHGLNFDIEKRFPL